MSKKEMMGLKTLKNLKLDEPAATTQKSRKMIASTKELLNKRKEKRILKSIKNLGENDGITFENFTIIEKQKNSIDKNLLAKSLSSHFAFSSLAADKELRD